MNSPVSTKIILIIFSASVLFAILLMPIAGFAHCSGKHTGNHPHCAGEEPPPPPPPDECTDAYPSFVYVVQGKRKSLQELLISSADGCRTEHLKFGHMSTAHVTDDWSEGVILFDEDSDNDNHYTVQRQDFTVGENGIPVVGAAVTLLPLGSEPVIPADEQLYYGVGDVMGDANHDSLYLVVVRAHVFGQGPADVINEVLIFNLNDMTEMRTISRMQGSGASWDCPDVDYPQYVPECYVQMDGLYFNQSGPRLYIQAHYDDVEGSQTWDAVSRIDIDRFDLAGDELPLLDWGFSAPELIKTGIEGNTGNLLRPAADRFDLPFPEHIALAGTLLNADLCAVKYREHADGESDATPDLWRNWCVATNSYGDEVNVGGKAWQTPNALLDHYRQKNGRRDIYRRYIDGPLAGTEELLIEGGFALDTGF